jgi:hypothetical protein
MGLFGLIGFVIIAVIMLRLSVLSENFGPYQIDNFAWR